MKNQTKRYHSQFTTAFITVLIVVSALAAILLIDITQGGLIIDALIGEQASESRIHNVSTLISDYVAFVFATAVGLAGAFVAITIAKNTDVLQASANQLQEQANDLSKLAIKNEDPAYHEAYEAIKSLKQLAFLGQAIVTTDQITTDPALKMVTGPLRASSLQSERLLNDIELTAPFIEATHQSVYHGELLELIKEARYRIGQLNNFLNNSDQWIEEHLPLINKELSLYAVSLYGVLRFIEASLNEQRVTVSAPNTYLLELFAATPITTRYLTKKVELEAFRRFCCGGLLETSKHYFQRHSVAEAFANKRLFLQKTSNDDLSLFHLLETTYGSAVSIARVWTKTDIFNALDGSIKTRCKTLILNLQLTGEGGLEAYPEEPISAKIHEAFDEYPRIEKLGGLTIVLMLNGQTSHHENFPLEITGLIDTLNNLNERIAPEAFKKRKALQMFGEPVSRLFNEGLSSGLIVVCSDVVDGIESLSLPKKSSDESKSVYDSYATYFANGETKIEHLVHWPTLLLEPTI